MPRIVLLCVTLAVLAAGGCRSDPELKQQAIDRADRDKAATERLLEQGPGHLEPDARSTDDGADKQPPGGGRVGSASSGAHRRQQIRGEWCWVVAATANGDSFDTARDAAVAAGRGALASFQRVEIRRDFESIWREEIQVRGGKTSGRFREEAQAVTIERTRAQLAQCEVLRANATRSGNGSFQGVAEVACPERVLFPSRRLSSLLGGGGDPEQLVRLATEYEEEGQTLLAERSLRWAYDRGGAAEAAMALAKHFGRRELDADALRWFGQASRDAGKGTTLAVEASVRARQITERVPTVVEIVDELRQLADDRRDPSRFAVEARPPRGRSGNWEIWWHLRDNVDRRVLKMWIDGEDVTAAWWADNESNDPEPSPRDCSVQFRLPRDAKPATVLFWALPLDSDLWPRIIELQNLTVALDGAEVSADRRMQLRDLARGLRRSSLLSASVAVP